MFKVKNDHEVEIANTEFEMKLKYTRNGMEIITSDDDNSVSTILSFDDVVRLYRWLDWLENDGMFNKYGDEEDV